jgi:hypothetical protein
MRQRFGVIEMIEPYAPNPLRVLERIENVWNVPQLIVAKPQADW